LIVLVDKEELSTQSFNNERELLTGSLWWGNYFLLPLGCNEDYKHLCYNSLLAKAKKEGKQSSKMAENKECG